MKHWLCPNTDGGRRQHTGWAACVLCVCVDATCNGSRRTSKESVVTTPRCRQNARQVDVLSVTDRVTNCLPPVVYLFISFWTNCSFRVCGYSATKTVSFSRQGGKNNNGGKQYDSISTTHVPYTSRSHISCIVVSEQWSGLHGMVVDIFINGARTSILPSNPRRRRRRRSRSGGGGGVVGVKYWIEPCLDQPACLPVCWDTAAEPSHVNRR